MSDIFSFISLTAVPVLTNPFEGAALRMHPHSFLRDEELLKKKGSFHQACSQRSGAKRRLIEETKI